jgi:glucose uptake protein GlcU
MTLPTTLLIGLSTATFVAAASAAKAYTEHPGWGWLTGALGLYTIGNLIMLRLISDLGMGVALSLSAVVQLIAVNLVAVLLFGERLTVSQTAGVTTAVLSVGIFVIGPYLEGK